MAYIDDDAGSIAGVQPGGGLATSGTNVNGTRVGAAFWEDLPIYVAVSPAFTPPNDEAFLIQCSVAKDILILRMTISLMASASAPDIWHIRKRSAAASGGTFTQPPCVPLDRTFPDATAVVNAYTVNPTPGPLYGSLFQGRINAQIPAPTGVSIPYYEFDFVRVHGRPLILHGVEYASWNHNAVAIPTGLTMVATITWAER